MSATIELFWDPVSPYTYLATPHLEAVARDAGASVIWRPFFLGGVMQATGNHPPGTLEVKRRYLFTDLRRSAALDGVGLTIPDPFPVNTVLPLRVAIGVSQSQPELTARFAKTLMAAYWRDGRNIADAAELGRICTNFGLDADTALAANDDPAIKDTLRANTDEAVARGAFGAPTMFVGEAMFWGQDRLEHLRAFLAGRLSE